MKFLVLAPALLDTSSTSKVPVNGLDTDKLFLNVVDTMFTIRVVH